MSYMTKVELDQMGFKHLGDNVKISKKSSIYNPELIEIGDNSRIDDFVSLSGRVSLGKYVHLAIGCNFAGGSHGIFVEDFCGFAYGVQVFTRIDDYSGLTLSNATIPTQFKVTHERLIRIGRHCKIGTYAIVLPGSHLNDGSAFMAQALVGGETEGYHLYGGNPLKKISPLSKKHLEVELAFMEWRSQQKEL